MQDFFVVGVPSRGSAVRANNWVKKLRRITYMRPAMATTSPRIRVVRSEPLLFVHNIEKSIPAGTWRRNRINVNTTSFRRYVPAGMTCMDSKAPYTWTDLLSFCVYANLLTYAKWCICMFLLTWVNMTLYATVLLLHLAETKCKCCNVCVR